MKNNSALNPVQKTVLVPLLVGLDPSVALFTAGIGLAALVGVILNVVLPQSKQN